MFSSQPAFAGSSCSTIFDIGDSCDDGDSCTTSDVCVSVGACTGLPNTGNSCDDGRQCTTGDTCAVGLCVGALNTGNLCGDQTSTTCNGPDRCVVGFCTNPNFEAPGVSCDNLDGQTCTGACNGIGSSSTQTNPTHDWPLEQAGLQSPAKAGWEENIDVTKNTHSPATTSIFFN